MADPASEIKILLADGDERLRSLLQEYLKRLGYEVFTARAGGEAIDMARKQKPHLIILEVLLPELGGLEVCRLLKSDEATRDILIIFLSGDDSIDNKVEALTSGAHDFLGKPFSPRELEVRIAAALHTRQLKPAKSRPATADKEINRGGILTGGTIPARNKAKRHLQVFLCHSSGDKPAVRDLYDRLRSAADYIVPWLDEEDLLPGQKWEDEIPAAVRNSDIVLVCLSNESINRSGYVQKEIKDALDVADRQAEGTIFLIPVKLEECRIPERLSHLQYVNLFEERGFNRLMRALISGAKKLGISEPIPDRQTTSPIKENWELSVRVRQAGDVAILDMSGRITIGEGAAAMRYAIRRLHEEGKNKILMNLEGVNYIDNSGVGELVSCYTLINHAGGQFKLLKLPPKVKNLLLITKLLNVFDTYDAEADALNSFR